MPRKPLVVRDLDALPVELVRALRGAHAVAVLTGAGVSAESGIATFRDPTDGLWAHYDPVRLASPEGFAEDPKRVWDWYEARRRQIAEAQPNPGHLALARLQRLVVKLTLITQNVDDLHERAGSQGVLHLHGRIFGNLCFAEGRLLSDEELDRSSVPPRCPCGAHARPGVVWFGEALPRQAFADAEQAVRDCDLLLVVGTSATVQPAAALAYLARRTAARVVVNPVQTEHAEVADYLLLAPSGRALPALVDAAFGPEAG